jgi:hypothetical protein
MAFGLTLKCPKDHITCVGPSSFLWYSCHDCLLLRSTKSNFEIRAKGSVYEIETICPFTIFLFFMTVLGRKNVSKEQKRFNGKV